MVHVHTARYILISNFGPALELDRWFKGRLHAGFKTNQCALTILNPQHANK